MSQNPQPTPQNDEVVKAFFLGRAVVETALEGLEAAFTDCLSALGKWDAERQQKMREFADRVVAKAEQARGQAAQQAATTEKLDLQATIDNLRAEIAYLRTELQLYRDRQG
ncbi:MAG: hypothetical protein HC918_06605 [Oscillatoriales cyanobacterium SM2_1_8]|nr:hypothetical protein [Oscillatoriales cyanobacterium SM2_1_8]